MNTWNDQRVGEALSEHEIEQYMTAFRVGLIRIDADPDEASRIDALIARTDFPMISAEVAATEAGVDQAVTPLAARAVDDAAALDVAQLVRRAAKRDQWAWSVWSISTRGSSGPSRRTSSWSRVMRLMWHRRRGCGCLSTSIRSSSTRIAWVPGSRRPR